MGRRRGIASLLSRGQEALKRGWFAVRAIERLAKADDPKRQFQAERSNFNAHKKAQKKRRLANEQDDLAAERYGDTLGWNLGTNDNHCLVCKKQAGNNYSNQRGTQHGRPGSTTGADACGANCHCHAGPPFPGARMLQ
jgi:hypothetical protein